MEGLSRGITKCVRVNQRMKSLGTPTHKTQSRSRIAEPGETGEDALRTGGRRIEQAGILGSRREHLKRWGRLISNKMQGVWPSERRHTGDTGKPIPHLEDSGHLGRSQVRELWSQKPRGVTWGWRRRESRSRFPSGGADIKGEEEQRVLTWTGRGGVNKKRRHRHIYRKRALDTVGLLSLKTNGEVVRL